MVGYVSVRDSSTNTQPVRTNIPIEANGNYSVDVAGLTPPFAFLASGTVGGRSVSLYSAATSADVGGTINITPFTDLIIRNIAATAVDAYLAAPSGMASLTTAELDAQRVTLTAQLAPALTAMGLSGSIDLLRATFNADSTGLDRFMDVVKVDTTTPGEATITNILDAANTLVIDTTAGTATGTLGTANLASSGTPLDGILLTFNTFSGKFATSLPSDADPDLLALFSSTFKDDGRSSSAFLTELTTDNTLIGLQFTHVVLDSIDQAGTTAQVYFTPVINGINIADGETLNWQMKKDAVTGIWQADGNQRIARVNVAAIAEKITCNPAAAACNTTTGNRTGLHFEINNDAMQAIGSAVVTGPSLPAGGVTLTAQVNQTWFNITTTNPNCDQMGGGSLPVCNNNWLMTDTEIGAVLPNSIYTMKLYDNSQAPVLLATYTLVVPVAPMLNTALAAFVFPSISGMVDLAGMGAATLAPSWSIPAGLSASYLDVYVWQTGTNANQSVEQNNLTSSSGTASLVFTAPPNSGTWSGGGYSISARDQYGREVTTRYQ
ncbi:MAG: hypothetical protein A3H31_07220 [Gallionellales bacterium RIFCSPLOWO2_02_FULL_57_47]|nr:MAG: hypothetical protein A3H31_07220 [Gallionellales bacterium RIFCSPLOWO2_02_FULL_57_47]OGT13897.1 MAG: hypothetical protein A3J49_00740 [Gallionellales bacterium RIFCSPHIGHO2_02_FULL_57_16]